jgi:hypothetical protein
VSDTRQGGDTATTGVAGASYSQTRAILRVIVMALAVAATLWVLYVLRGVTVAIMSVGYRHWLDHTGSDGLVADLLKPRE